MHGSFPHAIKVRLAAVGLSALLAYDVWNDGALTRTVREAWQRRTKFVDKGVRSGPHHHGELESVIYVINGKARFRYGDNLEHTIEAEAGDFVFVPPFLVHQEINPSTDEAVNMVVARSSQENIVVNVDLPNAQA